jgi:tRNA threonylcarbamoyladenosine biosynthesis protein TsaE
MSVKTFITYSRAETEQIAFQYAQNIKEGTVIAFKGDLGAGKTCFSAGFAKGMGYEGDVNSPTFAIVNEYLGGRLPVYHFDMYRISGWEDLYTTGYFEYLESGGVLLVEWSENITSALTDDTVIVTIQKIDENTRKITIED